MAQEAKYSFEVLDRAVRIVPGQRLTMNFAGFWQCFQKSSFYLLFQQVIEELCKRYSFSEINISNLPKNIECFLRRLIVENSNVLRLLHLDNAGVFLNLCDLNLPILEKLERIVLTDNSIYQTVAFNSEIVEEIREINFTGCTYNFSFIQAIEQCKRLEVLRIPTFKFDEKALDLVSILENNCGIRHFECGDPWLAQAQYISAIHSLKNLVSFDGYIGDDLEKYIGSKNVRSLAIKVENSVHLNWSFLGNLQHLQHLEVRGDFPLSEEFIAFIQKDRLESLKIPDATFDLGLHLSKTRRLKFLAIRYREFLSIPNSITSLHLNQVPITEQMFINFKLGHNVTKLVLEPTQQTETVCTFDLLSIMRRHFSKLESAKVPDISILNSTHSNSPATFSFTNKRNEPIGTGRVSGIPF